MLSKIIDLSVRNRWLVALVAALVAAVGLFELTRLPIDAVPDITNRQVQVTTVAAALSPEEMERRVTFPLETALAGIPGLTETRSISRNGFSQITAVFTDATDIYFARQQVSERLQAASESLPAGVEPALSPITTGLGEVLMWTVDYAPRTRANTADAGRPGLQADGSYVTPEGRRLTTDAQRATYLRTVSDWIISPQLRGTAGLAGVDTIGGYVKEYSVRPDPARLAAFGIGMSQLVEALERANLSSGAGYVNRGGEQLVVRADARVHTAEELAQAPVVNRNGLVVRVSDVATVEEGQEPRLGAASRNGREVVVGTALMLSGENSRTVAERVSARLDEIRRTLPPGVVATTALDRTELVDDTIGTVRTSLAEGALLVIVVLFLLLGNIRAAVITALVIPLAFLFGVIGMNRFGVSGNLMSLGALDFGLLVDGAVVVIERTLTLLAEKRAALKRALTVPERLESAAEAAKQMARPAAFGQLIILLVYAPLLALEGVEGKMFQPMAATVMLALVGAFILSFTFVPAMAALLVREPKLKGGDPHDESRLFRWLHHRIEPAVRAAVMRPAAVAAGALVAVVLGGVAFSTLGREFIPTLDEGDVAMHALRVPSTSLGQSLQMQLSVERAISEVPEVDFVFSKTGTAEVATDPMPQNVSDTFIILHERSRWPDPGVSKAEVVERIQARVTQLLGNNYEFTQPIQMRFNELISGVRSDVAIKVFGDDFDTLGATAEQIAAAVRRIPGAADVRVEQATGLPTLTATVNHTNAAALGLSARDVADTVAVALGGRAAGQIFEGDRRFDVTVRLPEEVRNDQATIESLPVVGDGGVVTPLVNVARFDVAEGPNQISREDGKRRIVVQANVRGRDLGGFVTEVQAAVSRDVRVPSGVWLDYGGQFENLQRAQARLGIVVPAVFVLIGLLLFLALGSLKEAALVFVCVPLALVGGVLALLLRGMPFSVSAAVGLIAVSGVATLNGLVLMQSVKERLANGALPREAVIEGTLSRLRAVLTTALVAILGFVPMALAGGAGAEVQKPLATVVIGGLITATVLTLLVLPTFTACLWSRRDTRAASVPAGVTSEATA